MSTELIVAGSTAITSGAGLLAWAKRPVKEPRYRILDEVVKGGYWKFLGHVRLQRKMFGRWWNIKKIYLKTDNKTTYDNSVDQLKNWLRSKTNGDEHKDPNALFDSKFDNIDSL